MAKQKREILIDLELESRDFGRELGIVNERIRDNKQEIKALSKDYDLNAKEIAELELANKELAESKRDIIKESKLESNSLNALRRRIIQLKKERDDLDTSNKESMKQFKLLTKEIKATTEEVKKHEEAGGDYRRSVGNYTNSMKDAIASFGGFGGATGEATDSLGAMFNIIKTNPIGIIITAVLAFTKALTDLPVVSNAITTIWEQINAVFMVAVKRVASLGKAISFLLDGEFSKAIDAAGESFAGMGEEIANTWEETGKLVTRLRELNTEMALINSERRASIRDQEELKNLRDNELISIDKRIAANEKLFKIEEEFAERAIANASERVQLMERQLMQQANQGETINDVIRRLGVEKEEVQALIDARTELYDLEEESVGRTNEFIMNRQSLLREDAEAEISLLEAKAEAEIMKYGETSERVLEIQREMIRKRTEMELMAVGEDQIKRQAIIQAARNEELELERDFIQKRKDLEQEEADAFQEMLDAEVEREQDAMDEKNKVARESLNLAFKDQQEFNKKELAAEKAKENAKQAIAKNTMAIFAALDKQGKASAIAQIIYDKAVAIGAAIKGATQAASATGPAAPFTLAAYITSMVGAVVGGFAQVSQILKADTGGTGTAFVRNPSGGGAVVPTLNGNAVDVSNFNQDNAGVGILGAAVAAQETQAQSQAQSVGNQVAANMPEIFVSLTEFDRAQENVNAKITEASLGG